jgi:hypothetical protein
VCVLVLLYVSLLSVCVGVVVYVSISVLVSGFCSQMDDIDAMFSDLLGEMDLLTQVSQVSLTLFKQHLNTIAIERN